MEAEKFISAEKIVTGAPKYSITELLGNKTMPTNERFGLWLLTENLENNSLITNIGDIIHTNKEEKLEELKLITEPFCDNIMIVKITDFIDCEGELTNGKIIKGRSLQIFCFLRSQFYNCNLAKHGVYAKFSELLNSNVKTINVVKQITKKDIKIINEKYKNPDAIKYKVELSDLKIKTLLKELPTILKELKKKVYYLLGLDITQDFAGIFNKEEVIKYLNHLIT